MSKALEKTSDIETGDVEAANEGELQALPAPEKKRSRVLVRAVLMVIVPIVAIAMAGNYWLGAGRYVGTENAYVKTSIAKVSAEISGKAVEVLAHAHMEVKKGDILVKIDPRPYELNLSSARADLDVARREIILLRSTLVEAEMAYMEATNRSSYFRKRYERQIELAKGGIVAGSRRDELENDSNEARDKVMMTRQKAKRVRISLGGDPDGPLDENPSIRAKIVAVDQALLDLKRTVVRAPLDGTVVIVPLVVGDQIAAGKALFAIVTDVVPWVDANFKETELTHVRVGQVAKIELDTYPGEVWEAQVKSISPATGAEFSILPPQNASGNWVKVVQRLPVRLHLVLHDDAPPLRAGMTAQVTIDTHRERSLDDVLENWKVSALAWLPDYITGANASSASSDEK